MTVEQHGTRIDPSSRGTTVVPSVTQRVLSDGARPLQQAARVAGLEDDALPSHKTLIRAAISGKLDAVKVAGRWLTRAAAIRRWIEAAQREAV